MNTKLTTSLFILFLFTSFASINAATVTWLGGNAAWDDAAQWDTGIVPTFGDDVIIPSGYCRIYNGDNETAASVEVQASGRLFINNGGQLEISGAVDNDGLHNLGRIYVLGDLAINDITQTSSANRARAIFNEKYIFTYSASQINIKYIDDVGIENAATNSYFRITGGLSLYSVETTAILNYDRFFNYGNITIDDCGQSSGFLIANTDDFRNLAGGEMHLDSDIYGGISNASANAKFRNYGDLNIDEVSVGILNQGICTNYSDGSIYVENGNSTAFLNSANSTITNDGNINITNTTAGIYNYGDLINNNSFVVTYSGNNGGLRNFSTGVIENYDYIYLNASGSRDIDNDGSIYNYNGAHIAINKIIDMSAGSSIANYGFFVSYGSNNHIMNGSFGNKGVIDDNYGNILPFISNDRVVVAPVSGPMQVGVPFPNVLDVASLTDVNIIDWKISPNGAVAGTYNQTTNEFTPNTSAIGVSTLYIEIFDLVSGVGRNFSLEIDSPIIPFTRRGGISSARNEMNGENSSFEAVDVKVYPNPSSGTILLESDVFERQQTQLLIFNSLGQLAQQEQLFEGNINQSIDFSSDLKNGIYFIKIMREGNEIDVKRVQLNR